MFKRNYYVVFALIFINYCNAINQENDSLSLLKIQKIYELYQGKYDSLSHKNFHHALSLSKKINNHFYEMKSYKSLLWSHGNGVKEERILDSVLHYANLFESKIPNVDKHKKMISGYYLNKGYVLMNSFGLPEIALESYYKSYEYINDNDFDLKCIYNIYISQIYKYKKKYNKAVETLSSSLKDTSSLKLNYKLMFLQNLARCYRGDLKYQKSLDVNNRIIKIAKEHHKDYFLWWAKNQITYDYFNSGKVKKAIDSALVVRNYYKENSNLDAFINNSYYLGKFYLKNNELDKAINYTEKSIEDEYSINGLPEKYDLLGTIYLEKRNFDKAKYYYKKKEKVYDSIKNREYSLYASYMNTSNKLIEQTKENEKISNNNVILGKKNTSLLKKNRKLVIYMSILIATLLFFLLLIINFLLYKKNKVAEREVEILKENEKKLLEEQIKMRDNELEATIVNVSKRLSALNDIKNQLEAINVDEIKGVKKSISSLIKSISEVSIITEKISSKYPSLALQLKDKFPDLSNREIDYCLLTKLNLTIKETASILNVSPNTVKVTRSKLKSKMNVASDVTLKEFLASISD